MKNILLLITFMTITGLFSANAQRAKQDPVLLRVGDRSITQSEFEAVYKKNNIDMQVADPKTVEEYLDLYINFNLKVVEAISLGMDTVASFQNELKTYREQLARPYFNDEEVARHILEEAYERMQYDIRASHIMIAFGQDVMPADTLAAYKKIMGIRQRALAGESFEELAREFSDDPSAKDVPATETSPLRPGNGGNLGYFSVLNMVYPFETAAYNTPVGQISRPVRTNFGYHIVKVHDRLPAMGTARVAHIMVMTPVDADEETIQQAEEKIFEVNERLKRGDKFEDLVAAYSEDQHSVRQQGEMPAFQSGRMVPEFIKVISTLDEPNQISEPVRTRYGWHIIKLLEKTPPPPFEDVQADLRTRIQRDSRSNLSKEAVVERLKKEYRLREWPRNLRIFNDLVDESIFAGSWSVDSALALNKRIFRYDNLTFTQQDFAAYLQKTQASRTPQDISVYINNSYNSFIESKLLAYEDGQLESKYPAFRNLMREYHDGILLFELTDKKVWTKAMEDTLGLQDFFAQRRADYMLGERLSASVYAFKDERVARDAREVIQEMTVRGLPSDSILISLRNDNGWQVTHRLNRFLEGDHPVIDILPWRVGVSEVMPHNTDWVVVVAYEVLPPQQAEMNEVRGLLISDYQNYLEKSWIEELRKKYDVYIDEAVLRNVSF